MDKYNTWMSVLLTFIFVVAVLWMATWNAQARADVIAEVGTGLVFSDEETNYQWQFRGGYRNVYVTWEHIDEWEHRILGQESMETTVNAYGLGLRAPVGDFEVYIEAGIADLDTDYWEPAGGEVAYTYLVNRHAAEGRTVPVPCAYGPNCYSHEWELEDDTPFASVGVAWSPLDHVKVQASYRWMNPEVYVNIKRPDWQEGQGYWEEHDSIDMSSANISVLLFW